MTNLKRLLTLVMALTLLLSTTALAAVEDTGFADVAADAWYAQAVAFVRDNGLMGGVSDESFAPEAEMSRAMLATVLYRAAGSPATSGQSSFSDVAPGQYYSDPIAWAGANGLITGYENGLFGVNDPITREQLATILWRSQGSPQSAGTGEAFADQSDIAAYALGAVMWAREQGIINGGSDGRFDPRGNATRAQVATILANYLGRQSETTPVEPQPQPSTQPEQATSGVLVAYFSNTGNTRAVAEQLSEVLEADLYEIQAQEPYTDADLNYSDSNSRATLEQNDPSSRPAITGSVENMDSYNVVFLGYPIWWGQAPMIISTFLESYDLSGKTIVPFCTSGSSGIGSSATNLHSLAPNSTWLDGQRFDGGASQSSLESWVDGLDLPTPQPAQPTQPAQAEANALPTLEFTFSDGSVATATLYDNPSSRSLAAMLPMTLSFEDFNSTEKIAYPQATVSTEDAPAGYTPGEGDLALYAPWGNLSVFYRDYSYSAGLVSLGRIESGLEHFADQTGDFTVTVSAAN